MRCLARAADLRLQRQRLGVVRLQPERVCDTIRGAGQIPPGKKRASGGKMLLERETSLGAGLGDGTLLFRHIQVLMQSCRVRIQPGRLLQLSERLLELAVGQGHRRLSDER